jgi:hypothetical protein
MPSFPLPATAWHGEPLLAQVFGNERRQHFLDVAADCGDDPNATIIQPGLKRLRDSGTDQRFNAKFRQQAGAFLGRGVAENMLMAGNLTAVGQFDQQQLPGNVKDR